MSGEKQPPPPPFEYGETDAARMLRSGLNRQKANGISLRAVAKKLRYAQATVLSHMANGRVAVPIERATQIAREVELDEREFLAAVVAQRAPEAKNLLSQGYETAFGLVAEIAMIAGTPPDQLTDEQKAVIREVAGDASPRRRWLSLAELRAVTVIREDCRNVPVTVTFNGTAASVSINGARPLVADRKTISVP